MIYLHIGRHKTGTTAIQDFFAANRDLLYAQGVLYPAALPDAPAHYGVALALEQRHGVLDEPEHPQIDITSLSGYLDWLCTKVRSAGDAVVSSEWFQKIDPRIVAKAFPPEQTTVVVYLREQLDYLVSAYAQLVKATLETGSFGRFATLPGSYEYGWFLDRWAAAYGEERLRVRIYDRDRLENGDSVADFLKVTGLDRLEGLRAPQSEPNVSLSAAAVLTKRLLNRVLTPEQHFDWNLYKDFEALAARNPSEHHLGVEPELEAEIRERYRAGNLDVSRRYFGSSTDVFNYPAIGPDQPVTDAEVATVLDDMKDSMPEAHQLLLDTVDDEVVVAFLPEEEQQLAAAIQRVRGGRIHGPLASKKHRMTHTRGVARTARERASGEGHESTSTLDLATTPRLVDFSTLPDSDLLENTTWQIYPPSPGIGVRSGLAVPVSEWTYQGFPAAAGGMYHTTALAAPCEVWGVIGRMPIDSPRVLCLSLGWADELVDDDGVEHGWELDIVADGSGHVFYTTDATDTSFPAGTFREGDQVGLDVDLERVHVWRIREGVPSLVASVEDSRERRPGHIWFGSASRPHSPPAGWSEIGGGPLAAVPSNAGEPVLIGGAAPVEDRPPVMTPRAGESLLEIGLRHGTDKAEVARRLLVTYDQHFSEARERDVTLLEIGVLEGNSLRMWREYFPHAAINGIDIDPAATRHTEDRIRIFVGDQRDEDFLDEVIAEIGPLDIVIDDGSHFGPDQIGSLLKLWPSLKPGGWYVIEDVHTSYLAQFGMGYREPGTAMEFLKGLADDVNDAWTPEAPTLRDCESISFHRETCIIRKRTGPAVRVAKRRRRADRHEIYLHIGRSKTGTTAIQQFLAANRERLAEEGVVYPSGEGNAIAHHGVVSALERQHGLPERAGLDWVAPANTDDFQAALRDAPTAIVSSEAFQSLDPRFAVELFPPAETTVVVYVREQLDHLLSAYTQHIQQSLATTLFSEFAEQPPNYRAFLHRWETAYGRERLVVRLYNRSDLHRGSAIDDFLKVTGLETIEGLIRPETDGNSSMSSLHTVTKRLLNRFVSQEQHDVWRLYHTFQFLAARDRSAARRVGVSPYVAREVRARSRQTNAHISRRFLGSERDLFHYATFGNDLPVREEEVGAMLENLRTLAPAAYAALLEGLSDDAFLAGLPEDERRLGYAIRTHDARRRASRSAVAA